VLQLGFTPSHLSFRFLQIIHASRFGFGTWEFSAEGAAESEFGLRGRLLDIEPLPLMAAPSSGGEAVLEDMVGVKTRRG
jgi:hypothetical protein